MVKLPLMIDSTDARSHGARADLVSGQGDPELDQPGGRSGPLRRRGPSGAALRRRPGRRHDRLERHGGHRRAQARGRDRELPPADRGARLPARGHLVGPAGFPVRNRRRGLHRLGGAHDRGRPRARGGVPPDPDDPRRLERQLRPAGGGARGAQLGLPLPRHPGRARRRDRQHRGARSLRRDPRRRPRARRATDLPPTRRHRRQRGRDRRVHGPLPRPGRASAGRAARHAAARRTAGAGGRGGLEGGARGRPRGSARRRPLARAARRHQRSVDGWDGGGRPALQRQPADRRRGAARAPRS